jgi:hypothetical protein
MIEIKTRKTALSQFDHATGECLKKPRSLRCHLIGDGRIAPLQRDLYSDFVASCCDTDTLDICQVKATWAAAAAVAAGDGEGQTTGKQARLCLASVPPGGWANAWKRCR